MPLPNGDFCDLKIERTFDIQYVPCSNNNGFKIDSKSKVEILDVVSLHANKLNILYNTIVKKMLNILYNTASGGGVLQGIE